MKEKFVVYIDTSALSHISKEERGALEKLLIYSEMGIVNSNDKPILEIHIHEIVLEEYRTHSRDSLQAIVERFNSYIRNLTKEWKRNPLGTKLYPPDLTDIFPTYDEIDNQSIALIDEFKRNPGVVIVKPTEQHTQFMLKNYFSWQRPFDNALCNQRDDKKIREKRRTHIPDAWIFAAAALDLTDDEIKLYCICQDGNLKGALEAENIKVLSNFVEILNTYESIRNGVSDTDSSKSENMVNELVDLETAVSTMNDLEKDLITRLLGYIGWFSPLAKEDLVDFMNKQGHETQKVQNAMDRLVLNNIIKDTGNFYIPKNKALCDNAASSIMPEILQLLEE